VGGRGTILALLVGVGSGGGDTFGLVEKGR
jgi:hypothetical protein